MLKINLLGPLSVERDGEPVRLPQSRKTRALLVYLVLSDRPLRRERLISIFWDVPDDPRGALRWSLSKLRTLVDEPGRPRIVADRDTVAFDRADVDVDLVAVRQQLAGALDEVPPETLELAARAFRGEFAEGLDLSSCPEFQTWCVAEREEARRLHAKVLGALIERLRPRPPAALPHAHKLVQVDPHDELAWAGFVRLLAAAGRRRAAEEQCAIGLRLLQEAGLGPAGPLLKVLRNLQKTADQAPALREDDAAPAAEPPPPAARRPASVWDMGQDIRFCRTAGGVRIAYSSVGEGPPLVKTANWLTHQEYDWQSPVWRHWMEVLSDDHCLIRYDQRGNGLSEWNVDDLSFEAFVSDLEAVVDAAGHDRFDLFGVSLGCSTAVAYAARHPERVNRLVLYGGYARGWMLRGAPEQLARRQAMDKLIEYGWGQDNPAFRQMFTSLFIPDGSAEQMQWLNDLQRHTTSPANAVRLSRTAGAIDVRPLLPQVRAPTLVLHVRDDCVVPFEEGQLLAAAIPGARFVPLDGRNHIILENEPAWTRFCAEVTAFLDAPLDPPVARVGVGARRPGGIAHMPIPDASPEPADGDRTAEILDQPAVAVLPFENMNGDPAEDYFADGIAVDLITALCQWRWFPVIAWNSTFRYKRSQEDVVTIGRELGARYLVQGNVRRLGDRVRVNAHLVDAGTGHHVWADRYDRQLGDIFELQDEITEHIVTQIKPELARAERRQAGRKHPRNLDAWDLNHRALAAIRRGRPADFDEALLLLGQSLEREPESSRTYGIRSYCHYQRQLLHWTGDPVTFSGTFLDDARRAVELDPGNWVGHAMLGLSVLWHRRDYDLAAEEANRAVELNPSGALARQVLGCIHLFDGYPDSAIPHLRAAIRLNPRHHTATLMLSDLALAYLLMERHDQAVYYARQAIAEFSSDLRAWQRLTAALGHLGPEDEAQDALAQLLRRQNGLDLDYLSTTYPFRYPTHFEILVTGLKRAGWASAAAG